MDKSTVLLGNLHLWPQIGMQGKTVTVQNRFFFFPLRSVGFHAFDNPWNSAVFDTDGTRGGIWAEQPLCVADEPGEISTTNRVTAEDVLEQPFPTTGPRHIDVL